MKKIMNQTMNILRQPTDNGFAFDCPKTTVIAKDVLGWVDKIHKINRYRLIT